MRSLRPFAALVCVVGVIAGCQNEHPISAQEAATAAQTKQQMDAPTGAVVAASRYRSYRWLTAEEMVSHRLGYDPTMAASTRYAVEQAVDDDLAGKGFQRSTPADFLVGFNNAYRDRNRAAAGPAFLGGAIELNEGDGGEHVEAYSGMEVYKTPQETFSIVFLDAQTLRLLWRGAGTENFASESAKQSNERIEAAVYRALSDLPVPLAR